MLTFQDDWEYLLARMDLVPNYPFFTRGSGTALGMSRFGFLDQILARSIYIELVSMLDAGLGNHLAARSHSAATQVLNNKIIAVSAALGTPLVDDLHAIRNRRNDLAHQTATAMEWKELYDATSKVGNALTLLGIISSTPLFEFFMESVPEIPDEDSDIAIIFHNKIGVKDKSNGNPRLICEWTEGRYHLGREPSESSEES